MQSLSSAAHPLHHAFSHQQRMDIALDVKGFMANAGHEHCDMGPQDICQLRVSLRFGTPAPWDAFSLGLEPLLCLPSPPWPCGRGFGMENSMGVLLGYLHCTSFPSSGPRGHKLGSAVLLHPFPSTAPQGRPLFRCLVLPACCLGFPIPLPQQDAQ